MKQNPAYLDAKFELRVVMSDGTLAKDSYPLRFRESDLKEAQELLEKHDWTALKELSISPGVE